MLRVDGEQQVVEVDPDHRTVRWGDHLYPVEVRSSSNGKVELEIAGESVVVEGWPSDSESPPDGVAVNGEFHAVEILEIGSTDATVGPTPTTPAFSTALPRMAKTESGSGVEVMPPMPGRVIEVRAQVGAHVAMGDVLLVLEAMKMRNDVTAPRSGTVAEVRAVPGQNVRARELLVRITPD